jgi:transcriptional regulator with XRE-family HTH domain
VIKIYDFFFQKKHLPNKGGSVLYEVGKCLLSDLLQLKRVTQQELADKLGVTRQQINHYVKDNRLMTVPIAKNIASILNCEIDELYEWIPVEVRSKRR